MHGARLRASRSGSYSVTDARLDRIRREVGELGGRHLGAVRVAVEEREAADDRHGERRRHGPAQRHQAADETTSR